MPHKLSDNALTFRALILAEIEGNGFLKGFADDRATPWRTWEEWQAFSTLGCNSYMVASGELDKHDPTLERETDTTAWPRKHRWKLRDSVSGLDA